MRKDLWLLLGNAQQRLGWPAGFPPLLFPVLHRAHTHAHQAGKGCL